MISAIAWVLILLTTCPLIHGFQVTNGTDAGIIVCSGDGDMFKELLGLLFRLDSKRTNDSTSWKAASLPISIAHCKELPLSKQLLLKHFFPTINIIDICANNRIRVPEERLKWFFCKTMALVHSPYMNTFIMDTDVIWLEVSHISLDCVHIMFEAFYIGSDNLAGLCRLS
jgi:hypothetical protein